MKQYHDIVSNVLNNGKWKENRTGTKTLTTFCEIFRHNMSNGFPLITTKRVAYKTMAVELEGFIKGITDKKWYQERKCKIWNEWANPVEVDRVKDACEVVDESFDRKQCQKDLFDLGPIYGYQWRSFNKTYTPCQNEDDGDWNNYTDQLKNVIDTLKTNPNDRRMVVSAWNPNQIYMMALPPCHYAFTLVHIDGVVSLCWKQRSCDLMLGVPFNIASYALLLTLICKETNMVPGELVGILEDCHIYENHIDGAKEQLTREPRELPKCKLSDPFPGIFEWTHKDFEIINYNPHEKINMGSVAV